MRKNEKEKEKKVSIKKKMRKENNMSMYDIK
jgi:hypothetical protein